MRRREFIQLVACGAAGSLVAPAFSTAGAFPTTIIDSQVHAYEANTSKRPWHSVPNWPDRATGDEMVAAMDKVGVDSAILISPFSMYRYDASYAVEVQRAHPGRFAIRSTPTIQLSAISSPTGSRHRARSASAS